MCHAFCVLCCGRNHNVPTKHLLPLPLPPGIAQDVSRLQREMGRLEVTAARAGAAAGHEVDTAVAAVSGGGS